MVKSSKVEVPVISREQFVEILKTHEKEFLPDRIADAREESRNQPIYWEKIIQTLKEVSSHILRDKLNDLLIGINTAVSQSKAFADQEEGTDFVILKSHYPLIDEKNINSIISFIINDFWFAYSAIILFIGKAALQENKSSQVFETGHFALRLADPRFTLAMLEVASLLNPSNAKLTESIARGERAAERLNLSLEMIAKLEAESKGKRAEAEVVAANRRAEIDEEWAKFKTDKDADIEAIKGQVADSIRLETNRNLWKARTADHLRWMFFSFGVLVVGIGLTIFAVLFFGLSALEPSIFEVVTRSSYMTQKLTLIVLCVVGAAWVLRFVARAIIENMTMRSDAQHRQSMLDTYLNLRGDGAMTEAERHIILTALFRPLPGQNTDDATPPSPVAEVAQKIISK